jgi:hypothetical protein
MDEKERAILTLEERHPRNDRTKEAIIREELGLSWVRYRQLLLRIAASDDAAREFPMVVDRVQRTTAAAVALRTARRLA